LPQQIFEGTRWPCAGGFRRFAAHQVFLNQLDEIVTGSVQKAGEYPAPGEVQLPK